MAGNTSTKKNFNKVQTSRVGTTLAPKTASVGVHKGTYEGQLANYEHESYAEPMNNGISPGVHGLDGLHDDIGEKSGFVSDGYIDKQGTPYGEAAKFNFLPPGMDISNQENAEIHDMPFRKLTDISYPGDGWMPAPRDVKE